jgi:hypothetical protein
MHPPKQARALATSKCLKLFFLKKIEFFFIKKGAPTWQAAQWRGWAGPDPAAWARLCRTGQGTYAAGTSFWGIAPFLGWFRKRGCHWGAGAAIGGQGPPTLTTCPLASSLTGPPFFQPLAPLPPPPCPKFFWCLVKSSSLAPTHARPA